MMTPYHVAIYKVALRYQDLYFEDARLRKFLDELILGCETGMPICKLNRWLGYIQGVLIERGVLTVKAERDATRPLFRPLDYPETKTDE